MTPTAPALAFALAVLPSLARADMATWRFEWQGAGGYSMAGALGVPADLAGVDRLTGDDAMCFQIEGFRDGASIGRWALSMLTEETTWALAFTPAESAFVVYGPDEIMPQAWNMDGWGTDCGPGGFGFNIGNAAQDLCLDGALVTASQVDPSRPFPAVRDDGFRFDGDACRPVTPVAALPAAETVLSAAAAGAAASR
jgi:hypothetical protein